MKKKRLLGLLLLAPLGLLAGCGGTTTLSFSPNWYYDNTIENVAGKNETLKYDVTFQPSVTEGINVNYETGQYVTKLSAENIQQEEGGTLVQAYRFETDYAISGRYSLGGQQGELFDDAMHSVVWFTRAEEGFRPIRSEKTVHATVPYNAGGADKWYTAYVFSYTVNYAPDLSKADYTLDITESPDGQKTATGTVELDDDRSVIDNEQITMALRALDLTSSSSALPFTTIDPQTHNAVTVRISTEMQSATVPAFTCNGETIEGNIDAVQVSCSYGSAQPGPTRRFLYAARTDENSKKYRSVLLRFENIVMYSLGTMTYTLKDAVFNDR